MKGSFFSAGDQFGISLPSQLKTYQELLSLILEGETQAVIEMFKKLKIKEIVGIRGL